MYAARQLRPPRDECRERFVVAHHHEAGAVVLGDGLEQVEECRVRLDVEAIADNGEEEVGFRQAVLGTALRSRGFGKGEPRVHVKEAGLRHAGVFKNALLLGGQRKPGEAFGPHRDGWLRGGRLRERRRSQRDRLRGDERGADGDHELRRQRRHQPRHRCELLQPEGGCGDSIVLERVRSRLDPVDRTERVVLVGGVGRHKRDWRRDRLDMRLDDHRRLADVVDQRAGVFQCAHRCGVRNTQELRGEDHHPVLHRSRRRRRDARARQHLVGLRDDATRESSFVTTTLELSPGQQAG